MATTMSLKQRRFAAAVAAGSAPLAAAGSAGYAAPGRKSWAARNMANPLVRATVALLREAAPTTEPDACAAGGTAGEVTRADVTRMLNADRRLAYLKGTPSAAVAASLAIARINGLIVERRQVELKPLAELSDAELAAHVAALEREARRVLAIELTTDEAGAAGPWPGDDPVEG